MMELLARTGMRVGELASLEDDAMVQISETFWLRIRSASSTTTATFRSTDPGRPHLRLPEGESPEHLGPLVVRNDGQPFDRRTVYRYVESTAKRRYRTRPPAQLRHTLATQAINRGMSLEAIAACLATGRCG